MSAAGPWWRRRAARRGADAADCDALVVPRPIDRHSPVHAPGAEPALRVLLFGSGPAAGWGVQQHDHGLGGALARALAGRTGRATTVEFLVDDHWEERDTVAALQAQHLADYDAVVVISVYRRMLLDFEAPEWRRHLDDLRDTLLVEAGRDGVLQILSLPWADAAARSPGQWGGAFGEAVMTIADAAADSVLEFRQIGSLQLSPPDDAAEWIGPAFTRPTYAAWGEEAAAALAPRLPAASVARSSGDAPAR